MGIRKQTEKQGSGFVRNLRGIQVSLDGEVDERMMDEERGPAVLWTRLEEISSPVRMADIGVWAAIVGFGALQFFLYQRASDFLFDDVFVADCAKSLLHGFYGIAGRPETNQPPGTAAVLAVVCFFGACSRAAYLRAMAVLSTLGFLATYELLRRQVPRGVAASICLLLISSQIYFSLATQWIIPLFPFFFVTMATLLVARKFEETPSIRSSIAWGALLVALIVGSLLTASAGVALLGAIVASLGMSLLLKRPGAMAMTKKYATVLLLGILAQGLWMHQKPAPLEWPLPGYPRPYLDQLKVKNGNYPELGMATPKDVAARVAKNALEHGVLLEQTLYRQWINVAWMSALILGPIILILLGWGYSIWLTGGGGLQEWYFAGHEFIYLLWPWNLEARFFLPIAPLACLYLWRGGEALVHLAKSSPRLLGMVWVPISAVLTISTVMWMRGTWIYGGVGAVGHAGVQGKLSLLVWLSAGSFALWMALAGTSWTSFVSRFMRWFEQGSSSLPISPLRTSQIAGELIVVALTAMGLKGQLEIGRNNLDYGRVATLVPPDVRAGEWVKSHTETDAVVMARNLPTVYHYAQRQMVWFPPSTDAKVLIEGIQRLKVNYVVVILRQNDYYLPPDKTCFDKLESAYPEDFHLVTQTADFSVFQVVTPPAAPKETTTTAKGD
jgi:hypothetical protein